MRKGDIVEGVIEEIRFPNKGIFHIKDAQKDFAGNVVGDVEVSVKNALPGESVLARITKKHAGRAEGNLQQVLQPAPCEVKPSCAAFGKCGGCLYLSFPEEEELKIKEGQVRRLLSAADASAVSWYEGILQSPVTEGYRNKMELTFGDEVKDGPMTLGMHKRGSFYDVADADACRIVNADFRRIIHATREYWSKQNVMFYHRMQQKGYLRHLLIREGMKTGEILVDLVTTTQKDVLQDGEEKLLEGWKQELLALELDGRYAGILHTRNDSIADVVEDQGTEVLYGRDSFAEELLGLQFTVTPFSFFQTNSYGAELLYETAREMIGDAEKELAKEKKSVQAEGKAWKPVVFDLYCGTGTISQLVAPAASKVIGVEIVEEAVKAARENADRNGIDNCSFIAGDVLKVIDSIQEKPDLIILDPPRDGVHPKAMPKILAYGVPYILYISCKPTSLARDLPLMRQQGYLPVRGVSINQFPKTSGVETVVLLHNRNNREDSEPKQSADMNGYREIREEKKVYGLL